MHSGICLAGITNHDCSPIQGAAWVSCRSDQITRHVIALLLLLGLPVLLNAKAMYYGLGAPREALGTGGCSRRLEHDPAMMRVRRQTLEHPLGRLKFWMGSTHFLTKTLPRVSTEMSLHVLAYNIKRMISIFEIAGLFEAIRTRIQPLAHPLVTVWAASAAQTVLRTSM